MQRNSVDSNSDSMESGQKAQAGKGGIIDQAMEKYGIPHWMKAYIYDYVKSNPVSAVKHAASFVDVKRKKGEITRSYVKLPNGVTFDREFIMRVINLFYYGESRLAGMYGAWADGMPHGSQEYREHFLELARVSEKHARAIRNLMEGLGIPVKEPGRPLVEVFDYVEKLDTWDNRIITSGFVMKYAYSYPFGLVFYRVFYHVLPEFMRSFGKVFAANTDTTKWLSDEAERIIRGGSVSGGALIALVDNALQKTLKSIDSEMPAARKAGVGNEIKLLRDISVAYPLHELSGLGIELDVNKEVHRIMGNR